MKVVIKYLMGPLEILEYLELFGLSMDKDQIEVSIAQIAAFLLDYIEVQS